MTRAGEQHLFHGQSLLWYGQGSGLERFEGSVSYGAQCLGDHGLPCQHWHGREGRRSQGAVLLASGIPLQLPL